MSSTELYNQDVYLTFPAGVSGQPVICNLVREFNLTFNIYRAQINPRKEGYLALGLEGTKENIENALAWLKSYGVKAKNLNQTIKRNEDLCMHCGLCLSLCPTSALTVDDSSRLLLMDMQKCSNCGHCAKVCPVNAMVSDSAYKI